MDASEFKARIAAVAPTSFGAGEAEYRAVFDLVQDALAGYDGEKPFEFVLGVLQLTKEAVEVLQEAAIEVARDVGTQPRSSWLHLQAGRSRRESYE